MMTDRTPLGRLIRWRTMMCLRLPIFGNEARFDSQDIARLDEIIEALKSIDSDKLGSTDWENVPDECPRCSVKEDCPDYGSPCKYDTWCSQLRKHGTL